jgi:hypothetical protein
VKSWVDRYVSELLLVSSVRSFSAMVDEGVKAARIHMDTANWIPDEDFDLVIKGLSSRRDSLNTSWAGYCLVVRDKAFLGSLEFGSRVSIKKRAVIETFVRDVLSIPDDKRSESFESRILTALLIGSTWESRPKEKSSAPVVATAPAFEG